MYRTLITVSRFIDKASTAGAQPALRFMGGIFMKFH